MKQNHEFALEMTKTIGMLLIMVALIYGVFMIKPPDGSGDVIFLFVGTFLGGFMSYMIKSNKREI